jgi:hypothetical protein
MQLWHGTDDATLRYPNFQEEIKQWTNVQGLSQTATLTDHPQPTWTRTRYGGTGTNVAVEGVSIQGVGHSLPQSGMAAAVIQFFGLDTGSPGSPSPTPTPTPTPAGACRVTYTMNTWNTGFTAAVTITNTSASPINTWSLTFTLPSGQTVTSAWNATISPSSGQVTATNVSYNGTIAAGASTNFGFQATHSGNTGKPTSFTLGGTACAVA